MIYSLDLGNGTAAIPCRDAHQALLLTRLWVAYATGTPATEGPTPDDGRHAR